MSSSFKNRNEHYCRNRDFVVQKNRDGQIVATVSSSLKNKFRNEQSCRDHKFVVRKYRNGQNSRNPEFVVHKNRNEQIVATMSPLLKNIATDMLS